MNPFTNEECGPDDRWFIDKQGSPVSEMVEDGAERGPDVVEAGYQPWGIDQGKRTPYLWAAVSHLVDEIESLKKKISELETARPGNT